jgi:hypothetical protein
MAYPTDLLITDYQPSGEWQGNGWWPNAPVSSQPSYTPPAVNTTGYNWVAENQNLIAQQRAQMAATQARQRTQTTTNTYNQPQQQQRDYMAEAQLSAQVERERIAMQQAQWQAEVEQRKQERLATLAAQPASWLEYAALSGQQPVIQPWMLPLMRSDYGIESAGVPIPGYNSTDMSGMPDLIPPSAQYLARVGPTAQQQFYGYEAAVHKSNPDETKWRQWSMAPPGGNNYRGLAQTR